MHGFPLILQGLWRHIFLPGSVEVLISAAPGMLYVRNHPLAQDSVRSLRKTRQRDSELTKGNQMHRRRLMGPAANAEKQAPHRANEEKTTAGGPEMAP